MSEQERRAVINRLREHMRGPMPDDLRKEVGAALLVATRSDVAALAAASSKKGADERADMKKP